VDCLWAMVDLAESMKRTQRSGCTGWTVIAGIVSGLFLALASVSAVADNLITNGSFETGAFDGWTFGPGVVGSTCPGGAPKGNCYAVGSEGPLSQTFATTIGTSYTISFYYSTDGLTPSNFEVTFGGNALLSQSNPPASAFHSVTFTQTATSSLTTLSFVFDDRFGRIGLDDVVVSTGAASAVPTTDHIALLSLAMLVLAATQLRCKRLLP
jgi:hypothetical protein